MSQPISPMANKQSQRRLSGNMLPFNRQQLPPFGDSGPAGPSAPFGYYDRYGPPEEPIAPAFREGYANEYNPNFWKPEPDFFPNIQNAPFPDRVPPPQGDGWQRPPGWREPEPPVWSGPEGRESALPVSRPPFPPPSNIRRGGGSRPPPNRMFEPSDNWKQTHERYRPYTPPGPNPNVMRNRFGFKSGPRRSFHGQPSRPFHEPQSQPFHQPPPYEDKWSPDEGAYGDNGPRRSASFSNTPTSPERMVRMASPASPRDVIHSSPSFVSEPFAPKRESPELPHLEALPPLQPVGEPIHIPLPTSLLPPKPQSRSSSHSSGSGSAAAAQSQPQPAPVQPIYGLPPKPPPQVRSRQPISIPIPNLASAHPPAPQVAPADDVEKTQVTATPSQSTQAEPQIQARTASNSRNNVRRPFNAPSFVPSTLAIDAPLMFPIGESKSSAANALDEPAKIAKDAAEAMDVSEETAPVKDVQEAVEAGSSSQSPAQTNQPAKLLKVTGKAPDSDGNAADDSDMDMSPPGSPVIKASSLPAEPLSEAASSDREASRPSLFIDTATSSPRVLHGALRQSSSASPVPTTPENADETAGDESDMDMSSPASETASSPPPEPQSTAAPASAPAPVPAKVSLPQPPAVEDDSMIPGLSIADSGVTPAPKAASPVLTSDPASLPKPVDQRTAARTPPPVAPAPPPASALSPVLVSLPVPISPSVPASPSPPAHPPTPPPTSIVREPSVQASTVTPVTATLEKSHVEVGELSPPASEETLREDTEATEKETLREDTEATEKETAEKESCPTVVAEEAAPAAPRNDVVPSTDPAEEKVLQELPLSEALRLVAKLRYRHDPMTQEARVEPILYSNRQLAESEGSASPQPEVSGQSVVEKEAEKVQQQLNDGVFGGTKHSLRKRFAQHQAALTEKVSRLRKEYMALHERWMVHCAKLDEVARASALEEAAATAGRTTRRTAAMGDAVRSDLEMEQILASLGNEELTDANHLSQKNAAVIPDMVSVTKGRVEYIYDDTNNLVEDPHEFYKLETGIDDWTEEEKQILIDKYAIHPKQFGIIADYLPNKTPAQCVTYYYLHKNTTIDFRKIIAQYNTIGKRTRRGRNAKQKGNALLADILKHDDEVSGNRDGTLSASGRRKRGTAGTATPVPPASTSTEATDSASTRKAPLSRRGTAQNTPDPTPTPDPEPSGQKRPRRRANPSAKAAAAALEADIPDEPVQDEERPVKRTRKGRKSKAELEAEAAAAGDESHTPSTPVMENKPPEQPQPEAPPKKKSGSGSGNWTEDDRALFLKLLAQHGDDFKRIASSMANKTTIQVAAFYRSHSTEMNLSKVVAQAPKRSPTPHENGLKGNKHATQVVDGNVIARSKSSGRMSPPPNPDASRPFEGGTRPPSSASTSAPPNGIPVPMYRPSAPYQGGIGSAFASTSRGNPNPLTNGLGGRPPTLTMSFPSAMAYSNLSPSSFAGQPPLSLPRSASGLPGTPGVGGSNAMMMEFSEFAPQPWQVPALTHPGGAPIVPGTAAGGGLPATLETTEDLVRYLEHRTRMSAGKSTEADFM